MATRRCIACRKSGPKEALWRFVAALDGSPGEKRARLVFDPAQKSQSRGAYLHRTLECVLKAAERAGWERCLRLGDVSVVKSSITEVLHMLREELLSFAAMPVQGRPVQGRPVQERPVQGAGGKTARVKIGHRIG